MEYGLYVHIPYCKSRCRYCDFYSCGSSATVPDEYVAALLRDFARHAPKNARPATVYFGGGTPGLLSAFQVGQLLKTVNPLPGAEITLEANPEGITAQKLAEWRAIGVNRLSLGVQSARAESLKRLGRLHSPQQARKAFLLARAAGFENVSGDLMLALPGYCEEEFEESLRLLQDGGVTHISAYLLKIEENTPFGKNPPEGLPNPDEAAAFYLHAAVRLAEEGYARYEISNFAKPSYEAQHNLLYWNLGQWLGLGPAAHSCLLGRRFSFAADLNAFLSGNLAPREEGEVTAEDYIMLQLRLAGGLSEKALQSRFGLALSVGQRELLALLCQQGLAMHSDDAWALTSEGLLVQNSILARLLPG